MKTTKLFLALLLLTISNIAMAQGNLTHYSLTVVDAGTGYGAVGRMPWSGSYARGTVVTLTAEPLQGSTFVGWSGAVSGSGRSIRIIMNANAVVYATFNKTEVFPFTVTVDPPGAGTVQQIPLAINYAPGTVVTLIAVPFPGYTFEGWQTAGNIRRVNNGFGASIAGNRMLTVQILGDPGVTANFTKVPTYPLTVGTAGAGDGSVTGGGNYTNGAVVTLTAVPDEESVFVGWSGAVSGSGTSVKVKISGATTETATFKLALAPGTYTMTCSASMSALTCCANGDCVTVPGFSIPPVSAGTVDYTGGDLATFKQSVENAVSDAVESAISASGCSVTASYSPIVNNGFTMTLKVDCSDVVSGCSGGVVTVKSTVKKQ